MARIGHTKHRFSFINLLFILLAACLFSLSAARPLPKKKDAVAPFVLKTPEQLAEVKRDLRQFLLDVVNAPKATVDKNLEKMSPKKLQKEGDLMEETMKALLQLDAALQKGDIKLSRDDRNQKQAAKALAKMHFKHSGRNVMKQAVYGFFRFWSWSDKVGIRLGGKANMRDRRLTKKVFAWAFKGVKSLARSLGYRSTKPHYGPHKDNFLSFNEFNIQGDKFRKFAQKVAPDEVFRIDSERNPITREEVEASGKKFEEKKAQRKAAQQNKEKPVTREEVETSSKKFEEKMAQRKAAQQNKEKPVTQEEVEASSKIFEEKMAQRKAAQQNKEKPVTQGEVEASSKTFEEKMAQRKAAQQNKEKPVTQGEVEASSKTFEEKMAQRKAAQQNNEKPVTGGEVEASPGKTGQPTSSNDGNDDVSSPGSGESEKPVVKKPQQGKFMERLPENGFPENGLDNAMPTGEQGDASSSSPGESTQPKAEKIKFSTRVHNAKTAAKESWGESSNRPSDQPNRFQKAWGAATKAGNSVANGATSAMVSTGEFGKRVGSAIQAGRQNFKQSKPSATGNTESANGETTSPSGGAVDAQQRSRALASWGGAASSSGDLAVTSDRTSEAAIKKAGEGPVPPGKQQLRSQQNNKVGASENSQRMSSQAGDLASSAAAQVKAQNSVLAIGGSAVDVPEADSGKRKGAAGPPTRTQGSAGVPQGGPLSNIDGSPGVKGPGPGDKEEARGRGRTRGGSAHRGQSAPARGGGGGGGKGRR